MIQEQLECFALQNSTDRFSLNVGNKLENYVAFNIPEYRGVAVYLCVLVKIVKKKKKLHTRFKNQDPSGTVHSMTVIIIISSYSLDGENNHYVNVER